MSYKANGRFAKLYEDEEQLKELAELILSSTRIFSEVEKIIDNMIESKHKLNVSMSEYDKPSWAYKQADTNGYLRALNEIKKLIKI